MLTIIRGLPGSGKSTYARSLGVLVVEADMYFMRNGRYVFTREDLRSAHDWCQNVVKDALLDSFDVVVSNTFTQLKEIHPYMDMAIRYASGLRVVKCTGEFGSVHNVPEEAIIKMRERWEDFPGEVIV